MIRRDNKISMTKRRVYLIVRDTEYNAEMQAVITFEEIMKCTPDAAWLIEHRYRRTERELISCLYS